MFVLCPKSGFNYWITIKSRSVSGSDETHIYCRHNLLGVGYKPELELNRRGGSRRLIAKEFKATTKVINGNNWNMTF